MKNTLLLYIRMVVVTVVSLFTARLTLQLLGVEDYGINNVVAGVLGAVTVITGTMISAAQRFLAYDLGKNDIIQYRKTFSMLINVFAVLCIVAIIIMEVLGSYLINEFLVIPKSRIYAAHWVYQFAIISFIATTMQIPFTSSIVSYERMGIYAYFTFVDVAFKLGIVYALYVTPFDRLITISGLQSFMSITVMLINMIYCKTQLNGCIYQKTWNSNLFKKMMNYAGWNMFGILSWVMNTQGQAILLNLFFGPIINAAKAIADRINAIVVSFSTNFYMAVNPQIIKSYSAENIDYTRKLVMESTKFCFYLLFIISIPLIYNMNIILCLWLGNEQVSDEMVRFCQLILIFSLINILGEPITQAMRATGNIRKYQIQVGCQTLLFLPITWVMFKVGCAAYTSMIVLSIIYFIVIQTRIRLVSPVLNIGILNYNAKVLLPILIVSIISIFITFFALWHPLGSTLKIVILESLEILSICCAVIYLFGLTKKEKTYLVNIIKNTVYDRKQRRSQTLP